MPIAVHVVVHALFCALPGFFPGLQEVIGISYHFLLLRFLPLRFLPQTLRFTVLVNQKSTADQNGAAEQTSDKGQDGRALLFQAKSADHLAGGAIHHKMPLRNGGFLFPHKRSLLLKIFPAAGVKWESVVCYAGRNNGIRQVTPMEWNIIVGLVCTVLGAVISYATFSRNKGKDDRSSGQQLGTVLTELGYIKSNTDEIKTEQREQRKTNTAVEGRLAAVEASAKSAHHRIDHLEAVRDEEH